MDPTSILPHRYPFLLLDTIDEVHRGERARGTKVVTGSEWLVIGTTGTKSLRAMPHLLIVEALAQLSAAVLQGLVDGDGAIGYFIGIDNARFRGEAVAGDVLSLSVELRQFRRGICKTHGEAIVDGRSIVHVDLTSIIRPTARG